MTLIGGGDCLNGGRTATGDAVFGLGYTSSLVLYGFGCLAHIAGVVASAGGTATVVLQARRSGFVRTGPMDKVAVLAAPAWDRFAATVIAGFAGAAVISWVDRLGTLPFMATPPLFPSAWPGQSGVRPPAVLG